MQVFIFPIHLIYSSTSSSSQQMHSSLRHASLRSLLRRVDIMDSRVTWRSSLAMLAVEILVRIQFFMTPNDILSLRKVSGS